MADQPREAYLAELDALLPFPSDRRAEILEEIDTHLDDAVDDGLTEHRAQSRLGKPVDLARELARPEQSALRLLAAAGAGVRAAIGPWLYGYLLTAVLLFVVLVAISAMLRIASGLVSLDLYISTDGGWGTAATAIPIGVGLYFAGRAATAAASIASRRLRSDVQPWVAVIGTALAAMVLLFVIEFPQNPISVVALSVAPLGVIIGVYRPDLIAPWPRIAPVLAIVATLLMIGLGLIMWAIIPPSVSYGEDFPAETWQQRMAIVGPTWEWADEHPPFESTGWWNDGSAISSEWHARLPGVIGTFSDLRLEAWHADAGAEWRIDNRYDAPFATGPVERRGAILTGTVVTDQDPDVHVWHLVLTGRAPDGIRYVLDAPGGGQSAFTGTAWDWVVAVTD